MGIILKDVIDKSKFIIDINLVGDCSAKFTPIKINYNIYDYPNSVFYICDDGYVFEKKYYETTYKLGRIIIPPYIKKDLESSSTYSFNNDTERYNNLKRFKKNMEEFGRSKIFDTPLNFNIFGTYWVLYQ